MVELVMRCTAEDVLHLQDAAKSILQLQSLQVQSTVPAHFALTYYLHLKSALRVQYHYAMSALLMSTEKGFFALRLKELREKADLSQAELAKQAGLGLSTVCQFEYGMREPTFDTLLKLCTGLGVTLSAFEPEPPEEKPRRRRTKRDK